MKMRRIGHYPIVTLFILVFFSLPSGSEANTSTQWKFSTTLGGTLGGGTTKQGTLVNSRVFISQTASVLPEIQWRFLSLGISAEFGRIEQVSSPSTNISGWSWNISPGAGLEFNHMSFFGGIFVLGQLSLSEPTTSGQSQSYQKPSGFLIRLDYEINSSYALIAAYRKLSFHQTSLDSQLASRLDEPLSLTDLNFGIGLRF